MGDTLMTCDFEGNLEAVTLLSFDTLYNKYRQRSVPLRGLRFFILHRFYKYLIYSFTSVQYNTTEIEKEMISVIYCLEDEDSIRDLMLYALNMAGFSAKGFADSKLFWEELKKERPELIMLDIMLPRENGISVLQKLRSSPVTADIPVIMATAKGSEYDKVTGLDLGADDYLCKPFGMMEMVSRIKAVLRRTQPKEKPAVLAYGDIVVDRSRHTVTASGQNILLTLKEYDLLTLLIGSPEQVFTRERLLSSVWGSDFVGESRTVDVHVGTLRTKLGVAGQQIKTVRGVGYKMGVLP